MLLKCKCNKAHEFQDNEYGKGVRLCTPIDKSRCPVTKQLREYRCTVCATPISKDRK